MTKELTRRELYDLVWARPMTKVAADLGISDVTLHKICAKHRIPAPGRGHWAKVAAGKPVKVALFRELDDPLLERIRIEGSALTSLPADVLEVRNRTKTAAAARRMAERQAPVPAVDSELHPLVAKLKSKLEGRTAADNGFVHVTGTNLFRVIVAPESVPRLVALLDRLFKATEAAGHQFKPGETALDLLVDDERITLAITEQTDRVRHEPTDKEMAALRKWEAERERSRGLGSGTRIGTNPRSRNGMRCPLVGSPWRSTKAATGMVFGGSSPTVSASGSKI